MPGYRYYGYNVNATCYDINISQNKIQPFLNYDFSKIVPKTDIKNSKYQSMYLCNYAGDIVYIPTYLLFQYVLSVSPYNYKWGLVGYMGSEILATDGKFVFSTPIARDRQKTILEGKPYRCYDNYFCYDKERLSGSIASYSGSYQIGMY